LVKEQRVVEITYTRLDGTERSYEINPVGVMFSDFYFYLIAYMADDSKDRPTVFRVDRVGGIRPTDKKYSVPYSKRFSEAEFRKRVQFMFAGELTTVKFLYRSNPEVVFDRLPTARVVETREDGVVISAEVYGTGIDMWLRSQGEKAEVI
jgi:predicted DNA-binding transcriptional regulator YafY